MSTLLDSATQAKIKKVAESSKGNAHKRSVLAQAISAAVLDWETKWESREYTERIAKGRVLGQRERWELVSSVYHGIKALL